MRYARISFDLAVKGIRHTLASTASEHSVRYSVRCFSGVPGLLARSCMHLTAEPGNDLSSITVSVLDS